MTSGHPDPLPTVRKGDILAGKYRVERVIGSGGMGVVVSAWHLQLDEQVAIKFLLPAALQNREAVERFYREARAAVKIKSEHVARVIDVGTLETGAPYIVMEFLDGQDLAALLRTKGPASIEQAVEFVLQACEALAEAHTLGIVHRDLKPGNLFCIRRPDGLLSVKVLDFGISKVMAGDSSGDEAGITRAHTLLGSPRFMSPEQMRSARDVDVRTDLWSLGIILFQLLTGRVPFGGEAPSEVMFSVANDPPTPLRHLLPQAPAGLEAVILRCLEKDRTRRYANVADLALALCPFAPRRARESAERISRTLKQAGLPVVHPEPVPGSGVGSQALSAPRSRVGKKAAKAAAAALFAVGLVSVVAWVALHGTPSHAPASDHDVVAAALPASAASSAVTALGEAAHPPVLPPPEPAPAAADAGTSAPAALSAPAVSVRPAERRPSPSGAPATPRSRPSAQPAPAPTYDPLNHL